MLTRSIAALAVLLSAVTAASVAAVTVTECIDAEGNLSFRDTCPPGMVKQGERKLHGVGGVDEGSIEYAAAANPITLYTVPDCDACDLVRNVLTTRTLPFTEKDVQDNGPMQEEMQAATGGLTVPALKVGDNVLTGYSRSAIDAALQQAGYPPAATAAAE